MYGMKLLLSRLQAWLAVFVIFNLSLLAWALDGEVRETISIHDLEKFSNQSLLWGPYRPNLLFGVRPRLPKSLMMGLMWARVEDFTSVQHNFRHTCEQHAGMEGYGWDEYDVRTGGRQTIHDAGNQIDLTTEFIKIPGGEHGGNWGVRVKGALRDDAPPDLKTTIIFYVAMEEGNNLKVTNEDDELGYDEDIILKGAKEALGDFRIDITKGPDNRHPRIHHPAAEDRPVDRTLVHTFNLPDEALWQAKAILFAHLKQNIDSYLEKYGQENAPPPAQLYTISNDIGQGNLHIIQKVFEGPFEFDVLYSSASAPKRITSADVTERIGAVTTSFSKRFNEVFKIQPPFIGERYGEFSKSLFSNLLGGIGYFYGDSVVDRSGAEEYEEENEGFWEEASEARARNQHLLEGPFELFTSIPSRPFFPRGFLWDEGFHLIPIFDWDADLTLDIVKSWFSLADEDGWIAREQILGAEARSKVPPEFQVQYPHYANPPSLFFILDSFLERIKAQQVVNPAEPYNLHVTNRPTALKYLRDLYPLLKRHYFWFRKSQAGDIKSYDREAYSSKEAYRWRGRTPRHILTSGLDDYPRAQPPHPGELHVDLISWIGMMTRTMKHIATALDETEDATEFASYDDSILHNIDDLHWDEREKCYCDATIDEFEESVHVCHKGYVTLFPWLLGLLPDTSPKVQYILDLLADPEQLWSDYGIRSLSKGDEFFGTEENYWRGPVWVNINYLVLKRLLETAQNPSSPHAPRAGNLYTTLRTNLVNAVYRSWLETGFAWEQYDPETGKGQRTQHFTGWTSLVVKVMGMPDLSGGHKGETKKEHVRDEL